MKNKPLIFTRKDFDHIYGFGGDYLWSVMQENFKRLPEQEKKEILDTITIVNGKVRSKNTKKSHKK